jgi:hypothetical protein
MSVVSLSKYPCENEAGEIWYPLDGYELAVPSAEVSFVQAKKGAKRRQSFIRKVGGGSDFIPVHAHKDGEQYYWFFSVWLQDLQQARKFRYCRVISWALLLPKGVSAKKFAKSYVVHHEYKERVKVNGKNLWVNYDAVESIVVETRAQHMARHMYADKHTKTTVGAPHVGKPKFIKKTIKA